MSNEINTYADGQANTGTGIDALKQFKLSSADPTGINNTAVGDKALESLKTTTNENTAVGASALSSNTSGENTAVGAYSATYSAGTGNTAVGNWAFRYNNGGDHNTAIGHRSLAGSTSETTEPTIKGDGKENTSLGAYSLQANVDGSANTAVGYSALKTNVDGLSNTALGSNADVKVDGLSYATALGADSIVNRSNSIVLGRPAVSDTAVDNVGIGTDSPQGSLHVNGSHVNKVRLAPIANPALATPTKNIINVNLSDYMVAVDILNGNATGVYDIDVVLPAISSVPDGQTFVIKFFGDYNLGTGNTSAAHRIITTTTTGTEFYEYSLATATISAIDLATTSNGFYTFVKYGSSYYRIV